MTCAGTGGQEGPLLSAPTPTGLSGKAPTRGSSMGPYRFTTQPFLSMRNCPERPRHRRAAARAGGGRVVGGGGSFQGRWGQASSPPPTCHPRWGPGTELQLSRQGPWGQELALGGVLASHPHLPASSYLGEIPFDGTGKTTGSHAESGGKCHRPAKHPRPPQSRGSSPLPQPPTHFPRMPRPLGWTFIHFHSG